MPWKESILFLTQYSFYHKESTLPSVSMMFSFASYSDETKEPWTEAMSQNKLKVFTHFSYIQYFDTTVDANTYGYFFLSICM